MVENITSISRIKRNSFLAIFISHSRWEEFIKLGPWGVSIFFCLSGFLMIYNYYLKKDSLNMGVKFPFARIKKYIHFI